MYTNQSFAQLNLEKVRQTFDKYDKDGAGSVNLAELVPVFQGTFIPSNN
jgi:Ca2+-binding EF-hand superfamily protein